jgi:RimJ/RimL family protein N-acetyltransferase
MMHPPLRIHQSDELVALRPLEATDFDALFAVASDPEIWALHPAHNRWQESVFRAFFDEGLASNGAHVVLDAASGAVIGSSRYDLRVCDPGEVEIGWTFLARAYWGGAMNRAIKRMMIEAAFAAGFDATIFLVGPENWRSRRAMEKIGGVLTDRRQQWAMADQTVSHVIYRISREDFAHGPLRQA